MSCPLIISFDYTAFSSRSAQYLKLLGEGKGRAEHCQVVQSWQTPNHHTLFIKVSHNQTPKQYSRNFVSMRFKLR